MMRETIRRLALNARMALIMTATGKLIIRRIPGVPLHRTTTSQIRSLTAMMAEIMIMTALLIWQLLIVAILQTIQNPVQAVPAAVGGSVFRGAAAGEGEATARFLILHFRLQAEAEEVAADLRGLSWALRLKTIFPKGAVRIYGNTFILAERIIQNR